MRKKEMKSVNDKEKTKEWEIEMINDNDKMNIPIANNIGVEGAKVIRESLMTNTTLTVLYLNDDLKKRSIIKWTIILNNMKE